MSMAFAGVMALIIAGLMAWGISLVRQIDRGLNDPDRDDASRH